MRDMENMYRSQREALLDEAEEMLFNGSDRDEIVSHIQVEYGWDFDTAEWLVTQAEESAKAWR